MVFKFADEDPSLVLHRGETARRKYRGMRKHRTVVVAKKRAMGAGSQLDRALDHRARASAINSGAGGCGPLAGKKKRALAVDPGLPIRPPNLGGTGRAVASSLLRCGGAVERGAGVPRPRRFQRNYTASLNLNLAMSDLWRLSTTACGDPPTLKAGTKVETFNFQVTIRKLIAKDYELLAERAEERAENLATRKRHTTRRAEGQKEWRRG